MHFTHSCACLALYDWQGDMNTVQFHALARSFFDANGVVPNICSVPRPDDSSETTSYSTMENRLRSKALPVDALLLYHTLPDYAQLVFGWDVTASIDCREERTMAFCCDPTLRGIELEYFDGLLDRIANIVPLCYGIGYLRTFEQGPDIYADGMGAGSDFSDEGEAEADRIASWFHERMGENRQRTGYLRDVYPLNVISEPHLSQRIDGLALADWIAQSPQRGSLRSLPGNASVWRINESQVAHVREQLVKTGLLIAYPLAAG